MREVVMIEPHTGDTVLVPWECVEELKGIGWKVKT